MSKSIVEFYSTQEKHRCGYCKGTNTSISKGMWAHFLSVEDYQSLIDRGWRRSGKYCYKPTMDDTCCPMYTIKCNALDFKLSKSQKKILKRFQKFLASDSTVNLDSKTNPNIETNSPCSSQEQGISDNGEDFLNVLRNKEHAKIDVKNITAIPQLKSTGKKETPESEKDPSNIPCKKAKQIRLERKKEKMLQKGVEWTPKEKLTKNKEKSLEDFFNDIPEVSKQRLKIKIVRSCPPSVEWLATSSVTHQLYTKYQMAIHGDPVDKCTEKQYHGFLVKSPLKEEYPDNGPLMGFGSFHQQYWLDNELIAVGVIDILTTCVSSVYFYYDPKYSHLSLGTYGALQEILFTQQLQQCAPSIKHYYMGYYIHSCPKMRYKGNFSPSFLLCPETYNWFPIEECIKKLNVSPYCRLNPSVDDIDTDCPEEKDLDNVLVLSGNTYMKYSNFKLQMKFRSRILQFNIIDDSSTLDYAKLVGKRCSQRMLLVKE